ncbi:MAG: hypothetical protein BGN88_12645 [Clostridiales bacterium 43-6]|nr:MAG: hypothetical protein BGN88_12645 [Clostridiales bacterium 43-6]
MFNDKSPYKIRIEKTNNDKHYFVSFIDGQNSSQEIEVSFSVYREIECAMKEVQRLKRSDQRHIERFELSDELINKRMLSYQKEVDEIVFDIGLSYELNLAISKLPKIQKRRFLLYYDKKFTYEQIAKLECCTKRAVKFSVDIAKEKVLEKIKKF